MHVPIQISLTDFVDFTIRSGTPKLTKVNEVKGRDNYHPGKDFWKPVREGIIDFHKSGTTDKKQLDRVIAELTDGKKIQRSSACVAGYKRFLGKKAVKWFDPGSALWSPVGISVRVNPELGLRIESLPHVLKLYFKAEPLSKRRVDIVCLLLQEMLKKASPVGTRFGIVDVANGKVFATETADRGILPLLMGEAASFRTIWESLE